MYRLATTTIHSATDGPRRQTERQADRLVIIMQYVRLKITKNNM